jgi:hypothetical protein
MGVEEHPEGCFAYWREVECLQAENMALRAEVETSRAAAQDIAREAERLRGRCAALACLQYPNPLLGTQPERAQLCHDGHEPVIHFGECPVCSAPPQSEPHDAKHNRK